MQVFAFQAHGSVRAASQSPKEVGVTGLNSFEATTMCPQLYTVQSHLTMDLCRSIHAFDVCSWKRRN